MTPQMIDNMSWEMAEVYGAINDQILINLARHFPYFVADTVPRSAFAYQATKLAEMGQVNAETVRIIRNGLADADPALADLLETAIVSSIRTSEPELYEAAKKGILLPPTKPILSPNQTRAFKFYHQQAADKLNLVNTTMLESTQQAYQGMVSDIVSELQLTESMNRLQIGLDTAAGETVTGVSSWNTAVKHATDRMKGAGITGFVDHAGHHWSAEAYAAMDIRTTVANTARSAVWELNSGFGNDLYLVSYHNGARPGCYPWQLKVISATDRSGVTYDLDGNEITIIPQSSTSYGQPAGLFGINCKHYPTPFIPGVSTIDGHVQSKEENDRVYAESQEQRRLERKLREEKRDLMMAKAQGASPEEIKRLQDKCKKSSEDIANFCKETGRARHRDREAVYTKREFPDNERYNPAEFKREQQERFDEYWKKGGEQTQYRTGMTGLEPNVPIVPKVASQATQPTPNVVQSEIGKATNPLVTETLPNSGIKPLEVAKLETARTTDEIINVLGGGDQTKGSCSSLAYAYAGQKSGYDVRDFRGGESQEFFSRNWLKITKFDGVDGQIERAYNDFAGSHALFKKVEVGKEYYFSTGRHAAIIRKNESNILEYLELQSGSIRPEYANGWKKLDDNALRYRFAAKKQHTTQGMKFQCSSTLVDIEKLGKSPDFVEMLKYINTKESKQKKGVFGGIR